METKNNKLVPELRFPEFEKDWIKTELSEVIELLSGYAFKDLTYNKKGNKLLIPKNFTTSGYASFNDNNTKYTIERPDSKYLCKEGDLMLLLTDLSPSCELLGKPLFLTKKDDEVLLNQRISKIIPSNQVIIKFLLYFFLSESFHIRIKNTATGSTVRHTSNKTILKYIIYLPSKEEQQKIANCLSSLDNVITAETEKLSHLKDHKKGLLQQLFPANGERVPQFRFSEFVGNGDWEEKELSIALDGKSSQIAKNKLELIEDGYPVYGADGMIGFVDSFAQENDYIAIVKDGSGVGNLFFYKGKSSLLGTLNYLISKDNQEYNLKWLYYLLHKISFKPFIKGSGIPHIYYKDYSKLLVLIPSPKEQQKIANCLSSADDLIAAQTEKIATLKAHKKGLMQQLFPNVNDVAV